MGLQGQHGAYLSNNLCVGRIFRGIIGAQIKAWEQSRFQGEGWPIMHGKNDKLFLHKLLGGAALHPDFCCATLPRTCFTYTGGASD